MTYLPGIFGIVFLGLAFVAPFTKGAPEAPLAFLAAILLAITQALVGLIVLIRKRGRPMAQGRRWRPMLAGVCCMGLVGACFLPFVEHLRTGSNRVPCASNLRMIGQSIYLYALDHGGALPARLDLLVSEEDLPAHALVCPYTGDRAATGATKQEVAAKIAGGGHCSYHYFGAGRTEPLSAEFVLACDRLENHEGSSINLLFGDGHVECLVDMVEARRLLEEVQAGHNPPRPSTTQAAR